MWTELQQLLSKFTLEVRKVTGEPYPPNTLHHIICGLLRFFLRQNGKPEIDFFRDKEFAEFRIVLDSEMKRLRRERVCSRGRKAKPMSPEEEEILWSKGILGCHSPKSLLNTIFFQNGVNFALRSGRDGRAVGI